MITDKKTIHLTRKVLTGYIYFFVLLFWFIHLSHASLAQTNVYIDPDFTGQVQNGSLQNPYNAWSKVNFVNGNTYLQKRGTTAYTTSNISVTGKNNITLGAYGEGARPKIIKTTSGGHVVDLTTVANCVVRDLNVSATAQVTTAVIIDGYGTNISPDNLIDNCELHGTEWGIRLISNATGNKILNCTIYDINDDGIYAKDITSLEIAYCNIYNINTNYFINPDQSFSAGDNIQLVSYNNLSFHIHNNILDHSSTGNKFCFIAAGDTYTGIIENNTMIGNFNNVTTCIYLGHTNQTVTIRNNILKDGSNAVYSYAANLQFHYNQVLRNKQGLNIMVNRSLTALNNVFYNNTGINIASGTGTTITSKNNIFHITAPTARVYITNSTLISDHNTFTTEQSSFLNGHSTLASWQSASGNDVNSMVANPLFTNPANDDYHLLTNSPCIDQGAAVGLITDFFGTSVPQASGPDIGIHEVLQENPSNAAPAINNQTFSIPENSPNASVAGQVIASDPDAGQSLTFSITAGNVNNAFGIHPSTGTLTVTNHLALDYETMNQFQLTVMVQDNGTGNLTNSAVITIHITDVNETPTMGGLNLMLNENSPAGTVVGQITANDPDQGQSIAYTLISGNPGNAFTLHSATGTITVSNPAAINYETTPQFQLIIRATDNGSPALFTEANVVISITNVNETPTMGGLNLMLNENSPAGTVVGQVTANDPDQGQSITYTLISGNTGNAFTLHSTTGMITVSNPAAINYEATPQFQLIIRATDNGSPALFTEATAVISINNVNETPTMGGLNLMLNENSPAGTVVGQITANDPDQGQSITYTLISGNPGNAFTIHSVTGMISVSNPAAINYETTPQFQLIIRATDNGSPPMFTEATATISLADVNECPVINNQFFFVENNPETGTLVGTLQVTDPDAGQSVVLSIVSGNTASAFSLNPVTGVLSVANGSAVNYMTNPVFNLMVSATDNGNPALNSTAGVTITVSDFNNPPQIEPQSFLIDENSPAGTSAGIVLASDPDPGQSLQFTIIGGNSSQVFTLNASSGEITLTGNVLPDFEAQHEYLLIVRVQDNGPGNLFSDAEITVNVTDMNESPSMESQNFLMGENSAAGTTAGQMTATDPDQGQTLSFSIVGGNFEDAFTINQNSGLILVNNPGALNFEITPQFQLTIRATDNGSPALFTEATATLSLADVNESPVIDNQLFFVENNPETGITVGTILANDPDIGQSLAFSIVSGNTASAFSLDPVTGVLSVANGSAVNYMTNPVFNLMVSATDNGNPALNSTAGVTITVSDANNPPQIEPQSLLIDENSPAGSSVGIVLASDPDQGQSLQFTIIGGNSNQAFALNVGSGEITLTGNVLPDFETQHEYLLIVRVQDNGPGNLFSDAEITVNVTDINENPSMESRNFLVSENSAAATPAGQMTATDPDQGQTLSFSIAGGNFENAFTISQSSGLILVNDPSALNFEITPQFQLTIRATDNGSPALFTEATATISLADVNESPETEDFTFHVSFEAVPGEMVGVVTATDPDPGQSLSYVIVSGNTTEAFSVDPNSGIIRVLNSSALNQGALNSFDLVVEISDNGVPVMTSNSNVHIDVISTNSAPQIGDQTFTTDENLENGTLIGQITAGDPDQGQSLTFSIISGNLQNAFYIDESGNLRVNNKTANNFEALPVFLLTVMVKDDGEPELSASALITIHLNDINEVPVIDPLQSFSFAEHAETGTIIGTVTASDPDYNQVLSYSITGGNSTNAFSINPLNGSLSLSGFVSFEFCNIYVLSVKVTDNGNPDLSAEAQIPVSIIDINEFPELSDQGFMVEGFSNAGTLVGTVVTSDPDFNQTLTYSIESGNTLDAFAISSSTGEITVNSSQALNPIVNPYFTLTIRVSDNGQPSLISRAEITIQLTSSNQVPIIEPQTFRIYGDIAAGQEVGQVMAIDPDPGQTLLFSISGGNSDNAFSLTENGLIIVNDPILLKNQLNSLFSLMVSVSDDGFPIMSAEASIFIEISNSTPANYAPAIEPQGYDCMENAADGYYVCRLLATDAQDDMLQFILLGGNTDSAFILQTNTGRLFVNNKAALDFESHPVFELLVRVVDNHGAWSDRIIPVNLTDMNEAPLVNDFTFSIDRPSAKGNPVGDFKATDPDSGQLLRYYILEQNSEDIFDIDQNTGIISIDNGDAFNNAPTHEYNLKIRVSDDGQPALSAFANVRITITNTGGFGENVTPQDEGNTGAEISAYPNPSSTGIFHVKFSEFNDSEVLLTVMSLDGRKIIQEIIAGNTEKMIDLSQMPDGIYILKMMDGRKAYTKKLIKN